MRHEAYMSQFALMGELRVYPDTQGYGDQALLAAVKDIECT